VRIADRENSNPWVQEPVAKTADKNPRHVANGPSSTTGKQVAVDPAGTFETREVPRNRLSLADRNQFIMLDEGGNG